MSPKPDWWAVARQGNYADIEATIFVATDLGEGYFPECEVRGAYYENWGDTLMSRDDKVAKYDEALNYWQMFASCATSGGEGTARMMDVDRVKRKLESLDFEETDDISVKADARKVYRAINEVDFAESFIVRWLLRLRGKSGEGVTTRNLQKYKFAKLDEIANKELVIGLAGRFWSPFGDLQKVDASNFREFEKPGYAKAVWNFSLRPTAGETHLTTETRIKCIDADSRRGFGFYWTLIQPFSGLIRMEMLKTIKARAESAI